jgi:hypothetical protein
VENSICGESIDLKCWVETTNVYKFDDH